MYKPTYRGSGLKGDGSGLFGQCHRSRGTIKVFRLRDGGGESLGEAASRRGGECRPCNIEALDIFHRIDAPGDGHFGFAQAHSVDFLIWIKLQIMFGPYSRRYR